MNLENKLAFPAKIGKDLIKEALHKHQEEQKAKVVRQVSMLLDCAKQFREIIDLHERRLDLVTAQLDAINNGNFTVEDDSTINFNSTTLNRKWDSLR